MAYWLDWHLLLVDDISYANEGLKEALGEEYLNWT